MQISIRHRLTIEFPAELPRAVMHLLLTPQSSGVQDVRDWQLDAPGMDDATGFIDACGNRAHLVTQTRPEAVVTIVAAGIVETHDRAGVVGRLARDPVPALFRRVTASTRPIGAIVGKFKTAPRDGKDRIALLHALMARVGEVVGGSGQAQSQSQDGGTQAQAAEAPAADFAHAFIGAARALEIPARYVTGYVLPDDAPAAFHAWAEAWDDGLGWIGFDPLLGHCPAERHVRVAVGLDAPSTAPVRSVPAGSGPAMIDVVIEPAQ